MGLAASQARLLTLTSRMNDLELKCQTLSMRKLRSAADGAQISAKYNKMLQEANNTKVDTFEYTTGSKITTDRLGEEMNVDYLTGTSDKFSYASVVGNGYKVMPAQIAVNDNNNNNNNASDTTDSDSATSISKPFIKPEILPVDPFGELVVDPDFKPSRPIELIDEAVINEAVEVTTQTPSVQTKKISTIDLEDYLRNNGFIQSYASETGSRANGNFDATIVLGYAFGNHQAGEYVALSDLVKEPIAAEVLGVQQPTLVQSPVASQVIAQAPVQAKAATRVMEEPEVTQYQVINQTVSDKKSNISKFTGLQTIIKEETVSDYEKSVITLIDGIKFDPAISKDVEALKIDDEALKAEKQNQEILIQNCKNSVEFFKSAIADGSVTVAKGGRIYSLAELVTTKKERTLKETTVTEEQAYQLNFDTTARDQKRAEAQEYYDRAINAKQALDLRIDIEMQNANTEYNAANTEAQSLKNLIKENVDRSFTIFG